MEWWMHKPEERPPEDPGRAGRNALCWGLVVFPCILVFILYLGGGK